LNVVQHGLQLFILESSLQRWNQRLCLFGRLGTQIGNRGQLELVQLLLHQQTATKTVNNETRDCDEIKLLPNRRDRFLILELPEPVRVGERLHEHVRELLFVFRRLVLRLPVLQQHVDLRYEQSLGVLELCKTISFFEIKRHMLVHKYI
jgi:hypothetical protein